MSAASEHLAAALAALASPHVRPTSDDPDSEALAHLIFEAIACHEQAGPDRLTDHFHESEGYQ